MLIAVLTFFIGLMLGAIVAGLFCMAQRQKHAQEKQALMTEIESKLTQTFKGLSLDALQSNNAMFLDLANSTLEKFQQQAKQDLDKRQQSIDYLVKPIKESLDKFQQRIQEVEKSRVGAYEGLLQQVRSLSESQLLLRAETNNLVKALRAPQVRGRWGEIQLQRVVELAGMLEHCDFQQQQTATDNADNRLRPDLIVRLPGDRNIVVDAKAPLWSFLEALEHGNEAEQRQKFKEHARHVREHMQQLSRKSYWEQFQPTPEFVILFLPGETFFSAALEHDPTLIEQGVTQRVILATPTTLIALLKSIAYGWQHEKLTQNAQQISALGKELSKRIQDMRDNFAGIGTRLQQAVESYNKTLGTLESRVLVSARRFQELNNMETTETLVPVDINARQVLKESATEEVVV